MSILSLNLDILTIILINVFIWQVFVVNLIVLNSGIMFPLVFILKGSRNYMTIRVLKMSIYLWGVLKKGKWILLVSISSVAAAHVRLS